MKAPLFKNEITISEIDIKNWLLNAEKNVNL